MSNCRNARGLRESFCSFDSSETDVVTPRVPSAYKLRVINNDGVLFRETCEMEGSRVVLLAGLGTICTAYERKVISARLPQGGFTSVVRYRTAHGWISEHRRDHHSLLEVLDILPPVGDNEKEDVKPDPVAEALTLREASSYVLSRTLISLRSIGTYLSRAILNQENMRARDGERSFSQSAPMLASSLGKVSKSYFTYALQKIDENSARPQSLVLFEPSSDVGSFESLSPTKQSASSQQPKTTTKLGRGKSRSMSFEEFDRDNYEEKTNVSISPGAFCLYFGAVIKYFMLPIMDDRNEHLNTYLFRYIHHYSVMDSIISAMLFGLATLHDAVSVAKLSNTVLSATSGPFKAISDFDLNSSGRCALMSLPSCLYIVRKLSQTDTYIKSNITETLVNMMTFPSDDLGPFQLQDMVYDCICTIGKRLLPLFESKIISSSDFPPDIQQFWLSIVSNLIKSFRASLPAFSVSKLVAESKRPESRRYIFDRQRSIETNNVVAARSEINRVDVSVPQLSPGVAVDINSEVAAAETIVHMSSQDESVSTLQPSIPDVESIILQPLSPSVLNVDQESSSTATASENPVDSGPYVATSESASLENTQPSLLEQFMDPDELAALGDDPELLAALQMSLGQSVSLESFASPSVVDASSAPLLPSVLSVSTEGGDVLVTPSHASVVVKKADKSMSFSTPTKEFVPADPTTERVTALKDLSSKYSNSIEENLRLSSCTSDLLHSWEGKSVGTMAPALVTFIVESDKSSYLTTSGGDLGSSWSLFSNLLDYLRSLSDQDSIPFPSLFGAFHLALCLLYEKETCDRIFNKLVETNATMKKFFDIFCNLLRKYGAAFSNLPDNVDIKLVAIQSSWISPAFLFLHKVLTLAKESNGDEESTRLSIDSDTIRETVSTTIGHLKLCSSSAVPLETQLLHSIVLFLETAMTDQDVIDEFVFEGGLSYLLGMVKVSSPSNSIDEKISATESQKLLSKILIKCLETEHELMYLAIYNIRHFFRKTNSNRVTMSDFLTHFASSITRSPTGFGSVAGALFKTVHRGEPNQSSVYLELFDKQTQDHNLKNILKLSPSLDRPYDSNDRAQNTAKLFISVLLNHSESEKMLSKADSINCLSDAALALPRASTIFSKVEVPTMIHSSSSLVQWITHTYISIGVPKSTDPSISVASSAVIARSVFRFFLILCSRRGPCRSQVLKSIIQTAHDSIALLSDTSVSVPTSQKQNDENVSKLCRLSSLISSAIRLSTDHAPQRHTLANQQNFTLDAVSQLVQSDVPEKLVLALDEIIRKSPQSSENAITSLLDPIELFTRPSIQEYVKRAVLEEFKLPSADDPHELGHASDDFAGSTSGVNHEPLVGLQTDDGTNVSFGILGGNIQEPGDIAADGNDNNNDDDGVEEGDDHPHDEDDNHDGDDDEDDDAEADEEDDEEEDGDESGGDEDEDVEGEEDEGEDEVDEMELEDDEGDDPYDPVENGLENRLETEILRLENALRAQNAAGGTDESWELLNATDGSRAAGSNTTPDARNQFISHMLEGLLLDINDDGDGSERAGVDHDILRFLNRHGSNEALAAVQRLRAGVPILEGPPGGQVPYIHPLVRRPGDVLAVRPAIDRDDQELRLHDLPFPGRASMFAGMEGVENDDFPMLRPFVPSTGRHLPTGLNNRNGNNRPSTNANSRRSGARAVPSAVLQLELQLIASSVSEPVIEPTPVVPLPMPSTTTLPSSTNAAELSMEDAQAVVSELTIMLRETSIHAEESIHLLDQVDEVLSPIASLENIPAPTSEIPLESNISTLISESIIPTESIAPDGVDAVSEVFEEDPVPSDIEAVVVEIETAIATPSEIVDSESVSILTSSGIGSSLQTSSINGGEVLPETAAAAVAESNAENNGESEPSTANAPARLYNCPEGYEEEVFYSLPDFMQRELSEQQNEASQQVRELAESAGFDYETLMSLPESIRQEILDQARRDLEATTRGASSDGSAGATGAATDPDNASFLQSLTPELRAEVLLTAEPDFLATLPPELIAEAQMHRDQAAANWQRREMSNRHQAQQATGDEGEEEDEEGGVSIRPRNAQSTDSVFSVKGFMKVPVEKNDLVVFSSRVVLLITKLLSSSEHSQSKAKLLIPIVQNLSQYKVFRELILGLLTGALHNSKELANLVERADSCKRSSNLSTSDNLEGIEAFIKSATPLKRFRMLVQLKHILSNTSVLYDLLKPSTVEESCTSEGLGDSSNSLIETIVESLSLPFLQQSSSDILAFLTTLEIITKPLDHFVPIPDATSTIPTDGSLVKIPDVLFSKVNFHRICDILSWDVCTKNIAELVIKITVRLSNNPKNAIILTQEIVEVLSDLFGESEARLAALQINLDEIMLTIPAGQNSKKTLVSYASKLPIGSCGARQYERLLRCVQTLHLVSSKQGRTLIEVAPSESFDRLWSSLERVLSLLRAFLAEDSEKDSLDSKRPQSSLTSLLGRILPAIESFFLYHTFDILDNTAEKKKEANVVSAGSSSQPVASESVVTTAVDGETPSVVADPPESVVSIRKQSQITMPGEKYRQTERYRNLNIFLQLNEGKADEKLPGDASIRKTLSLRYVQSSGFSIHGAASSQLPRYQCLISFCHAHKGLLNLLVKSQPHLLDDSLAAFVKVVNLRACLSFENKRKYFFLNLRKLRRESSRMIGLSINLRRNKLFEDSFQQMQGKSGVELQGRLRITFQGEEGIDAGGLTREWFSVISKEIFNPNYALFTATADGLTFQPNPLSNINSNHLDYFKFVGRVIGKAICDGHLMDAHFTRFAIIYVYFCCIYLLHFDTLFVGPSTNILWVCIVTITTSRRLSLTTTSHSNRSSSFLSICSVLNFHSLLKFIHLEKLRFAINESHKFLSVY